MGFSPDKGQLNKQGRNNNITLQQVRLKHNLGTVTMLYTSSKPHTLAITQTQAGVCCHSSSPHS